MSQFKKKEPFICVIPHPSPFMMKDNILLQRRFFVYSPGRAPCCSSEKALYRLLVVTANLSKVWLRTGTCIVLAEAEVACREAAVLASGECLGVARAEGMQTLRRLATLLGAKPSEVFPETRSGSSEAVGVAVCKGEGAADERGQALCGPRGRSSSDDVHNAAESPAVMDTFVQHEVSKDVQPEPGKNVQQAGAKDVQHDAPKDVHQEVPEDASPLSQTQKAGSAAPVGAENPFPVLSRQTENGASSSRAQSTPRSALRPSAPEFVPRALTPRLLTPSPPLPPGPIQSSPCGRSWHVSGGKPSPGPSPLGATSGDVSSSHWPSPLRSNRSLPPSAPGADADYSPPRVSPFLPSPGALNVKRAAGYQSPQVHAVNATLQLSGASTSVAGPISSPSQVPGPHATRCEEHVVGGSPGISRAGPGSPPAAGALREPLALPLTPIRVPNSTPPAGVPDFPRLPSGCPQTPSLKLHRLWCPAASPPQKPSPPAEVGPARDLGAEGDGPQVADDMHAGAPRSGANEKDIASETLAPLPPCNDVLSRSDGVNDEGSFGAGEDGSSGVDADGSTGVDEDGSSGVDDDGSSGVDEEESSSVEEEGSFGADHIGSSAAVDAGKINLVDSESSVWVNDAACSLIDGGRMLERGPPVLVEVENMLLNSGPPLLVEGGITNVVDAGNSGGAVVTENPHLPAAADGEDGPPPYGPPPDASCGLPTVAGKAEVLVSGSRAAEPLQSHNSRVVGNVRFDDEGNEADQACCTDVRTVEATESGAAAEATMGLEKSSAPVGLRSRPDIWRRIEHMRAQIQKVQNCMDGVSAAV